MFTGLVEDVGTVKKIERRGDSMRLFIECNFDLTEIKIGDSISIDGVCLTVVELLPRGFQVEVSPETFRRTTLHITKQGRNVNLERSLRLSDRLGGHLVQGHIDGIGKIKEISQDVNSIRMKIAASGDILKYIIKKGSVTLDGVSLTVNECNENEFGVNIIPHTAGVTTLSEKKVGDSLNIENDVIGKYVEKFLSKEHTEKKGESRIDTEFLKKHGFF
ncbi:MAG: riboflavin synthase [Thermodesulfobacteriota bacterium]|nr:riboflavin synthase [Thermodesulfobacteriota bacterium]